MPPWQPWARDSVRDRFRCAAVTVLGLLVTISASCSNVHHAKSSTARSKSSTPLVGIEQSTTSTTTGPLAIGSTVPGRDAQSWSFLTVKDGFGIDTETGNQGGALESQPLTTDNGGQSWMVTGVPIIGARYVGDLDFIDAKHGYAVGLDEGFPFFITDNGGATWHEPPFGHLGANPRQSTGSPFGAKGSSVWVTSVSCTSGVTPSCHSVIEISEDYGTTWTSEDLSIPSVYDSIGVAAESGQEAYVLANSTVNAPILVHTTDAGRTWNAVSVPSLQCEINFFAPEPSDLWLFCGEGPATNMTPKALYRSYNGGATWSVASSTGSPDTSPPWVSNGLLPAQVGSITLQGNFPVSFAAASPNRAWLTFGRGDVEVTSDGGKTWTSAFPYPDIDAFSLILDQLSPSVILAIGFNAGIWSTTDGSTWSQTVTWQ